MISESIFAEMFECGKERLAIVMNRENREDIVKGQICDHITSMVYFAVAGGKKTSQ